jgi:hypothetical protein
MLVNQMSIEICSLFMLKSLEFSYVALDFLENTRVFNKKTA